MKKHILLSLLIGMVLFVNPVFATIMDFDDLATTQNQSGMLWGDVPTTYNGFIWEGWEVANIPAYQDVYSNSYSSPSSPNAVYNGDGTLTVTTSNDSTFNIESAAFSSWARNDSYQSFSSKTLTIRGYLDTTLIDTVTFDLSSNSFIVEDIGLYGIDRLEFEGSGNGEWWLMDDLTYTTVPVPGALWLVMTGLGIAGLRKRFNK